MTTNADWQFSYHAMERALDMALDMDELRECLNHPEYTYPNKAYPGQIMMVRGRIALPVDGRTVVTVMWNGYFERDDTERNRDDEA